MSPRRENWASIDNGGGAQNLDGMGLSLEQTASANLDSLSAEHIRNTPFCKDFSL